MAFGRGRSSHERETLIFRTPEEAQEWRSEVDEKLKQRPEKPARQTREVVQEAVVQEFEQRGEAVTYTRPWEHTREEHHEAQQLLDVAFAKDLDAAIAKAKKSLHYPRNLDLMHDILTGEMYELVQERGVNQQVWSRGLGAALALAVFVLGIIIILLLI